MTPRLAEDAGAAWARRRAVEAVVATQRPSVTPDSVNTAIEQVRHALTLTPSTHPEHARLQSLLDCTLLLRFRAERRPEDLERAVAAARAALATAQAGNPSVPGYRYNLALDLHTRYEHCRNPADLDEASAALHAALTPPPRDTQMHVRLLVERATVQRLGHQATSRLEDLDAAVASAQAALRLAQADPPLRAAALCELSDDLFARAERTNDLDDTEQAVTAGRAAVAAAHAAGSALATAHSLVTLAGALRLRAARFVDAESSGEAADALATADQILGPHYPDRSSLLLDLASVLGSRAGGSSVAELDRALAATRQAEPLLRAGDPRLTACFELRSTLFLHRYRATGDLSDARAAVDEARSAVASVPPNSPDTALLHHTLSLALAALIAAGTRTRPDDLAEAEREARAAVASAPPDDARRAGYLGHLAGALWLGYLVNADRERRREALLRWREAVGVSTAPARERLTIAVLWARSAVDDTDAEEAVVAYTAAVELLPLAAWRGLERGGRETGLAPWASLGADAAACATTAGRPDLAVELLEQSRSVLWSQQLDLRDETEELEDARPDLAARLTELRAVLEPEREPDGPPLWSSNPAADAHERARRATRENRMRAARAWDRTVAEVRALPGFGDFLRPRAAVGYPAGLPDDGRVVIVNVSEHRCDALIADRSGTRSIPLPHLDAASVAADADRFRRAVNLLHAARDADARVSEHRSSASDPQRVIDDVLGRLWETVAAPVFAASGPEKRPTAHRGLNAPGEQGEPGELSVPPRVWWCPTGPLTFLPLHAAGRYADGRPAGEGVFDRAVSSYTPTLRALHRATPRDRTDDAAEARRMLIVAMPQTPGQSDLRGVEVEARAVAAEFPDHTALTGRLADTTAVSAALVRHPLAHFACHGGVDADEPTRGGLFLYDGVLTVGAISRLRLEAAGLAFLSACRTAWSGPRLPDEAITVAAALQLAGFRHVVATLWTLADAVAPTVARTVYARLQTGGGAPALGRTAYALHEAVRQARDDGSPVSIWATYIHVGA